MFHFLGFLFIILIAILFIGLSIIGTVIRGVFGLGRRRSSNTYQNGNGNYQSGREYSSNERQQSGHTSHEAPRASRETAHAKHKKLFSKDEGEYVDFEEISKKSRNTSTHLRLAAKKSFINAAHSSASTPFTTTVLGCNACGA